MATEKELKDLKANWKIDPCWDIWDTEGFEEHKDELIAFQSFWKKHWAEEYHEHVTQKAIKLNCSFELAEYIEGMERQIEKLAAQ